MVKHIAGVSAVYFVLDTVNNPHVVDDVDRPPANSEAAVRQLATMLNLWSAARC
ncbi:hypothetical protein [Burkholderia cenocepacia]|jgi:hypothetical protein|uniref:Uncharacterized protein n=1 Tax=Dechloromonas agitata TaxID=73030 RepID=A0A930BRH5_9RHOO|nr:hypothetical protein [Burkholderia cenocepacia]MBF1164794.1 hypothetical protein [Dechloromonas agitata]MDI9689447.1 hypothetical protein [Burkholderia cenocepacia]